MTRSALSWGHNLFTHWNGQMDNASKVWEHLKHLKGESIQAKMVYSGLSVHPFNSSRTKQRELRTQACFSTSYSRILLSKKLAEIRRRRELNLIRLEVISFDNCFVPTFTFVGRFWLSSSFAVFVSFIFYIVYEFAAKNADDVEIPKFTFQNNRDLEKLSKEN